MARDMTQERLARAAGITVASVCRVEKDRLAPSKKLLEKIAGALSIDTSEFYGRSEIIPVEPSLRPVERRLLAEVRDVPDALVEDLIRGVRQIVRVGRLMRAAESTSKRH
jgi:transcriptional regulator with XRE-family HTH domain